MTPELAAVPSGDRMAAMPRRHFLEGRAGLHQPCLLHVGGDKPECHRHPGLGEAAGVTLPFEGR
jgi:hypothetical protein